MVFELIYAIYITVHKTDLNLWQKVFIIEIDIVDLISESICVKLVDDFLCV